MITQVNFDRHFTRKTSFAGAGIRTYDLLTHVFLPGYYRPFRDLHVLYDTTCFNFSYTVVIQNNAILIAGSIFFLPTLIHLENHLDFFAWLERSPHAMKQSTLSTTPVQSAE